MRELTLLPAITVAQIMLATWLLSRCVPSREGRRSRSLVYALGFIAGSWALNALAHALTPYLNFGTSMLVVVASFVLVLAAQIGFVLTCGVATPWQALFCATMAYAMQNLATGVAHTMGIALWGSFPDDAVSLALEVASTAVVYGCCYLAFIRRLEYEHLADIADRGLLFVLVVVVFVNIIFNLANGVLEFYGTSTGLATVYGCVHAIICAFILFSELRMLHSHQLEMDNAALEQLMAERERQYGISRETIEAINVKCHDIRHQIRMLEGGGPQVDKEVLDDIAREVNVYDAAVKTGNDAIDTILTEKGLVCEREGISLTCIAEGHLLDFMRPSELYALLGNALENAIEAVREVEDPDRRVVSLSISNRANIVLVHVENAFAGLLAFEDGLPVTTKADKLSHGFGMKSMRMCVERYGGTLSAGTHGSTFFLNMMIPLPTR